jgi:hypothetical protein
MNLGDFLTDGADSYFPKKWRAKSRTIVAIVSFVASLLTIYGYIAGISAIYWLVAGTVFAVVTAFYLGTRFATYQMSQTTVSVEGCIKNNRVLWKGELYTKNEKRDSIEVEKYPMCPDCQTHLQAEWSESSYSSGARGMNQRALAKAVGAHEKRKIWRCPGCQNQYLRPDRGREKVEKLFEKHFSKMWDSENEPYSIDTLRREYRTNEGEQPSARQLWVKYVNVTEDSNLSTDCFF